LREALAEVSVPLKPGLRDEMTRRLRAGGPHTVASLLDALVSGADPAACFEVLGAGQEVARPCS
jgi:hypothetical protein